MCCEYILFILETDYLIFASLLEVVSRVSAPREPFWGMTCLTSAFSHYKYTSFTFVDVEHNPDSLIRGLNNSAAQQSRAAVGNFTKRGACTSSPCHPTPLWHSRSERQNTGHIDWSSLTLLHACTHTYSDTCTHCVLSLLSTALF